MWIGKKFSLNNFISHLSWLEKLSPAHTHSLKTFREFLKPYELLFFWVRVTHKILNVNWEKIHSIILSVTCHGFRNFPQLIHIPSYPFMNFWNPVSYYFSELESLIKCWMWIGKKFTVNNFISHLSWFQKLFPAHTHSLKNLSWIFETLWVIFFLS